MILIKNYSFMVLFLCFLIITIIIQLKTSLLSVTFYVIILVYVTGVLLMLFYLSLMTQLKMTMFSGLTKYVLALFIVMTLIKVSSNLESYSKLQVMSSEEESKALGVLHLAFIAMFYFLMILNYFSKMKFLRQVI